MYHVNKTMYLLLILEYHKCLFSVKTYYVGKVVNHKYNVKGSRFISKAQISQIITLKSFLHGY